MNYRHAFHAGNFADVFKHAILTRILLYLARKNTAFRVIDTHAGEGAYDFTRDEAVRTGEWRGGIGRLGAIARDSDAGRLLAPFLELVGVVDAQGRPALYPGSPLIIQKLLRRQDRAIFCELHGPSFAPLAQRFRRDQRIKTLALDGWVALNAFTPPPERRGLILVDPPFEARDELLVMAKTFVSAFAKWPGGVYALWRPIKNREDTAGFVAALQRAGVQKMLQLELGVAPVLETRGLTCNGLTIINPPYGLAQEALILLPALAQAMEYAPGQGFFRVEEFCTERSCA